MKNRRDPANRGLAGGKRQAVDWEVLKRRLATTSEALKSEFAPSAQQRQEILRARARALAQEPAPTVDVGAVIEVLEFMLAQEAYALETCWIREVYPLKELTPLPCTPGFVMGIANVRGRILSVIDIKKFFDLPEKGLTDLNKAIILQDGPMEFGVLADQIIGARWLPLADIQAAPPTFTGVRSDYLRGVTGDRLIVLDAKKMLRDPSIVVDEEVSL